MRPLNPPRPLTIENPGLRDVIAAMCPRCHGKLWTDIELSQKELGTVLVCETCGGAYDLIPILTHD